MGALVVEKTLGLAQIQDAGRFAVRHLGITQGGAVDWVAMRWANWLLGNPPGASVIEIPLGGLRLRSGADTSLAVCGADLAAELDGEPMPSWQTVSLRSGQQLVFNPPRHGLRSYLAVPGGFHAPAVLGSAATVTRDGFGGLDGLGGALREGDRLPFSAALLPQRCVAPEMRSMTLPVAGAPLRLDMVLGAQYRDFSARSLFAAFNEVWRLDIRGDRMGVRLTGPTLRYTGAGLVSEGIPLGAIQVPPDGQPFVLLNDRQTIGGYPRLGALTPLSCARIGQCPPGSPVLLKPVGAASARQQMLALMNLTTR